MQSAGTPTRTPAYLHRAPRALSIVVGIVIGSGIFLVPREMMAATGRVSVVYLVWTIGGLLSLFGAMSYAEVSALRPRVGGEYAFIREAYGDLPAFLYTWTWVTIAKPASIATIAAGLMRVLGDFSAFSFLSQPAFAHLYWSQLAAIIVTWLITWLNIVSTRESANVQAALTWLKIILIVGIAVVCFASIRQGSLHNLATVYLGAHAGLTGFMTALIAALWAYDGWSDVSQLAGEVRDPQRSMPLALIGGVFIVAALYMLLQCAVQYILPAAVVASSDSPTADALRLIAGSAGAALVTSSAWRPASAPASSVSLCSLRRSRALRCCARPSLPSLARRHPSALPHAVSVHLPSSCPQLASSSFHRQIPSTLLARHCLGVVLLRAHSVDRSRLFRHREPDVRRPYSVNGYPFTPILFILAALMIIVFSFITEPRNSIAGAAVILLGVPLYWWMRRSQRASNLSP